jgi:hypothetical protein
VAAALNLGDPREDANSAAARAMRASAKTVPRRNPRATKRRPTPLPRGSSAVLEILARVA